VLGKKITLIDNGTLNSTQIGDVAHAFMSDEATADGRFSAATT
jgi:hypothetical protein